MPKKSTKKPANDRIVYEVVTPQQGTRQVEASNTKELKAALTSLLPLDPYSVQAAAHLAQTERATIQGTGWSIKRLGKLAFVPDETPASAPKKRKEDGETSNAARPAPKETKREGAVVERMGVDASSQGGIPVAKEGGELGQQPPLDVIVERQV